MEIENTNMHIYMLNRYVVGIGITRIKIIITRIKYHNLFLIFVNASVYKNTEIYSS